MRDIVRNLIDYSEAPRFHSRTRLFAVRLLLGPNRDWTGGRRILISISDFEFGSEHKQKCPKSPAQSPLNSPISIEFTSSILDYTIHLNSAMVHCLSSLNCRRSYFIRQKCITAGALFSNQIHTKYPEKKMK